MPVASTARTRSACTPGSRRSAASQPSPEVPRPNSPARSPTASTHTSARGRRGDRRRDARGVLAGDRRSPARSVEPRDASGRARRAAWAARGPSPSVAGGGRRRGAGRSSSRAAPSGRRRAGRPRRSGRPAAQRQRRRRWRAGRPTPGPAAGRASRLTSSSRSQVRHVARAAGCQSASSRPELALLDQHPAQRPVDQRLVDRRRARPPRRSGSPIGSPRWAARRRCRPRSASPAASARVGGHAVQGLQERDREVVGDDGAGEAPRRRAAARSAAPRRRRRACRRCRCRSSSPSGRRRRAAPSRTAAGSRRPARGGPIDTGARLRPPREAE